MGAKKSSLSDTCAGHYRSLSFWSDDAIPRGVRRWRQKKGQKCLHRDGSKNWRRAYLPLTSVLMSFCPFFLPCLLFFYRSFAAPLRGKGGWLNGKRNAWKPSPDSVSKKPSLMTHPSVFPLSVWAFQWLRKIFRPRARFSSSFLVVVKVVGRER